MYLQDKNIKITCVNHRTGKIETCDNFIDSYNSLNFYCVTQAKTYPKISKELFEKVNFKIDELVWSSVNKFTVYWTDNSNEEKRKVYSLGDFLINCLNKIEETQYQIRISTWRFEIETGIEIKSGKSGGGWDEYTVRGDNLLEEVIKITELILEIKND